MELSHYQKAIVNHVCNNTNNLLVSALAGSGKTFTMIYAVKEYAKVNPRHEIAMSAFNVSIANEIAEKINKDNTLTSTQKKNIMAKTSHSIGRMAIVNYLGHSRFDIKSNRLSFQIYNNVEEYSNILTKDCKKNLIWDFSQNVCQGYNLCRLNLLTEKDNEQIVNIFETYDINCVADEIGVVTKMLATAYDLNSKYVANYMLGGKWLKPKYLVLDFIDLLTFGATHPKYCPKFDLFIGDEAQDFNLAQHKLMQNCLKPNGKFVCVGDPNQAINGFAGSLNDSFDKLAEIDNTDILPLSVNYRCGQNIIEKAQTIVPTIIAHEGAWEGNVEETDNLNNLQPNDYVLCRTKAPLVKLAMKLLAHNKLAFVLGADLGKGLISLMDAVLKGVKGKFITPTELQDKLQEYYNTKVQTMIDKGVSQKAIESSTSLAELKDKIDCLDALSLGCTTTYQIRKKIDELFAENNVKNAIMLMTAHKSKGLEADNVHIILPNKLPLVWKGQLEWQYQQEMNLLYVAITRAKKNLYFVNMEEEALNNIEFNK